ncbi:hypothetical protein GGR88_001633 [Sphingomonas jejuensis]|uniref:Uncharacterized protein n=1 Tax=Sphingomonas jejuensis TaxID=904715 RepID=A0ABX0XLP9_9SPHN|nr:hypothetical protein [Sphingomonas jejuensis]NJC34159.1 hypothetical protein [Sphingomonas jejuensis]
MDDYEVRVTRTPGEERDYFLRRSSDHAALASRCDDPAKRSLHQRFATLYALRAEAYLVEDNQSDRTKIPGTG